MNALLVYTIATCMPRVPTPLVDSAVLVMWAMVEMGHFVKVTWEYHRNGVTCFATVSR